MKDDSSSCTSDHLPKIEMPSLTSCTMIWCLTIFLQCWFHNLPRRSNLMVGFQCNPWLGLPWCWLHALYRVWWRCFKDITFITLKPPKNFWFPLVFKFGLVSTTKYKKNQTGIISPRIVLLSQGGTPRPIKY